MSKRRGRNPAVVDMKVLSRHDRSFQGKVSAAVGPNGSESPNNASYCERSVQFSSVQFITHHHCNRGSQSVASPLKSLCRLPFLTRRMIMVIDA